jgi:hypothetical protein
MCRLRVMQHTSAVHRSDEGITVTAVVVGVRRHAEERRRRLYYVRCTHIDLGPALMRQRKAASATSWHSVALGAIGSGTIHSCNELRVSTSAFVSSDGYYYRFDGWYDADALQCVEEGNTTPSPSPAAPTTTSADQLPSQPPQRLPVRGTTDDFCSSSASSLSPALKGQSTPLQQRRPVPDEWVAAMERDSGVCEVVYLCYAFRPWFAVPYTALQYLALPEDDVCHSVYLCHRCLSPFFTREQYYVHLEGCYCLLRRPPGRLLYHDETSGYKAFLVDGAKDLHYARCLSLLGKHFIESKLLANDVDLYEYVVVTMPRASLPFCEGEEEMNGMSADEFCAAAADFDSEDWAGDVVMGYFSRLKHHPDHTLSCIVTLPIFQRMRVATFLLDLAYWMTQQRQRLCGGPRCCGQSGGAISRPFSPHGQALLLSYWRRALLRALGAVAGPRRHASRITPAELSFTLAELQAMMDVPIHVNDLEMLLLQSEFTFYAAAHTAAAGGGEEGEADDGHPRSHTNSSGVDGVDASATPPSVLHRPRRAAQAGGEDTNSRTTSSGQRYTVTIVLESAVLDAAQERPSTASRRTHIVFAKRWLAKDGRGAYAYDVPQFHY